MVPQDLVLSIEKFLSRFSKVQFKNLTNKVRLYEGKEKPSRIIALVIYYHYVGCKNYYNYYKYVCSFYKIQISYKRFIHWKNKYINLIKIYLEYLCDFSFNQNNNKGFSIIDSTKISINKKYKRFGKLLKGYSSTGSFYGFKLHTIINNKNLLEKFEITAANVHDVNYLKAQVNNYYYKTVIGDKGYNFKNKPKNFVIKPKNNQKNQFSVNEKLTYKNRLNTLILV